MIDKKNMIAVSAVILTFALLGKPSQAYAWGGDWHHHGYHHYEHPSIGLHVSVLPQGYFSIVFGGSRYYYCDGVYYNRFGRDYVVVLPPTGAVLPTVPVGYQVVIVNGVTYYTSNGIYYVPTPQGYQLVTPPVQTVALPAVASAPVAAPVTPVQVSAQAATSTTEESFTVNVPNKGGGYTAVTLKRSGDSFIGPQGELYPYFPKIAQLQAMYASEKK